MQRYTKTVIMKGRSHMARIRKSLQNTKKMKWEVALYIRLSREDGNDESLSVANQRKILTDYLQNNWTQRIIPFFIPTLMMV